ncbi:hypothetical protein LI328DRAFT_161343 [Trichoderma asperelloides]|nr:hypothetical protein LI328DRAFT_161343 [Trichoderma asperelloides]
MGNIFGAPTPRPAAQPEPQRRAEYHRPRYQAPEILDIQPPPRNVRPVNIGALQTPRCLHYTRVVCEQGNYCPFVHEGDALQRQTPRPHTNLQRPTLARPIEENIPQARKPCRYFAQGRCYKGAQCRFSHEKNGATIAENQDDQFNSNDTYELGGAWVKFDKAAAGTPTSVIDIRIISQREQNTCSAIVKSSDISFAKSACSKLNILAFFPDFKASVVPIRIPVSQSPYQVDCRKVHCAWDRSMREANLIFGDKTTALSAQKILRERGCKMLGPKVKATYQGNQNGQGKWVVKLRALSDATNEQDIIKAIPKFARPPTVQLGGPSYVPDPVRDSAAVKSMLLEIGPLERWNVSPDTKGRRFNAYATFLHEASARDAMSTLNNKPLPFSETTKLSVKLAASAKFKIQAKIYNVVSPQIDKQKAIWARQYISAFEIPFKGPFRILKLECENHQLLVQAKASLEKIISGQIVRMEGKDLRCGNFRQNGKEFKQIKSIEDLFQVVIIPDIRKSQFRIFGQEECSQSDLEEITTMLQGCTPEGHVIELNDADFVWASNGGLRFLKSRLGEGKVSFNAFASKNKRISIRGSKADYNNAMAIIASRQTMSIKKDSSSEMECPACFCEAEDPIRMSCDHVYCSNCFIQMCEAEKTATREFRICCVKATNSGGTTCQKSFSLSEIQEHLPAEAFEAVLEKSFESYVSRHPGDFTYCQTPDCDQVYRIASPDCERPSTFTCKKCLVSICTFCHSSHPGKPCDKAKSIAQSILSDKTKEALGIKSCPKCSMLMEKRDGCNHMTCKCGAHVCWVCLMSFDEARACYTHMTDAHGGYYGN